MSRISSRSSFQEAQLSSSNTAQEMVEKRLQYFAQGAKEVWIFDADGRLEFWVSDHTEAQPHSLLCAAFPNHVDI